MDGRPREWLAVIERELRALARPEDAAAMARYMRDQFPFLGVRAPARKALERDVLRALSPLSDDDVRQLAELLFAQPERELHYVACRLLRQRAGRRRADHLAVLRWAITEKSWWDTVDDLSHGVGDLVLAHPSLEDELDRWNEDDDIWLVRVSIIYQRGWRAPTDEQQATLLRRCEARASHSDFFVRKAIGWALRDRARTHPELVRAFVEGHPKLSGLSRREALKHLGPLQRG